MMLLCYRTRAATVYSNTGNYDGRRRASALRSETEGGAKGYKGRQWVRERRGDVDHSADKSRGERNATQRPSGRTVEMNL
ncbi:unnamed protein product [Onchocerca flexuosa]|uniref:Uncharacterized protein n=1 Tax=Onchocerca flexuosa TaxID=387005 RepID=A0A183HY72_9BILA|nr:unnamed protein product [Onchocerca flexuosa]